jgi:hypothetical protein
VSHFHRRKVLNAVGRIEAHWGKSSGGTTDPRVAINDLAAAPLASTRYALDLGAESAELLFDAFVTAIDMINA